MPLLERYLFAIGQYLPSARRDDILAELRANLSEQIADQEEQLGRDLSEAELIALIRAHGRPSTVAGQYAPQQALVGPELLPFYWLTLRKALPAIVTIEIVTEIVHFPKPTHLLWGALTTLFAAWAWITLGFFSFQLFAHIGKDLEAWDPHKLPKLPAAPQAKSSSLANRIADLAVSALFTAWLVAIPFQPFLILGPGLGYLRGLPAGLSPEWHIFYLQILTLAIASLALKALMLFMPTRPWHRVCELVVQALGVAALGIMVQARAYFVPYVSGSLPSPAKLLAINTILMLSFRFALAFSFISLVVNIWKYANGKRSSQSAALA
jgi:hypothetical protein